jgi:hypothetical protein
LETAFGLESNPGCRPWSIAVGGLSQLQIKPGRDRPLLRVRDAAIRHVFTDADEMLQMAMGMAEMSEMRCRRPSADDGGGEALTECWKWLVCSR